MPADSHAWSESLELRRIGWSVRVLVDMRLAAVDKKKLARSMELNYATISGKWRKYDSAAIHIRTDGHYR